MNTRRTFFKQAGLGLIAVGPLSALAVSPAKIASRKPVVAVTNGVTLNVHDFGATGDGKTKDTLAIQQTIDRCSVLGGGEVLIPAGNYLTGAFALRSDVIIRHEKEAVILGSPDFADYPVSQVRWEGKWIQGHVGLIYALNANNTGIIGP